MYWFKYKHNKEQPCETAQFSTRHVFFYKIPFIEDVKSWCKYLTIYNHLLVLTEKAIKYFYGELLHLL